MPTAISFLRIKLRNLTRTRESTSSSDPQRSPGINVDKLGVGSRGWVYVARESQDSLIAVKTYKPKLPGTSTDQYNDAIKHEFAIVSTLQHENIIKTKDLIWEHGLWHQTMEYAPCDLLTVVKTQNLSRRDSACCFKQICNGLAYLHRSGIAHRDIKLDNIVVSRDGIMKIIDFGTAVAVWDAKSGELRTCRGATGSEPYMSPEAHNGMTYDPRAADIWALAILYCTLVLRRFPWKAPRITEAPFRAFTTVHVQDIGRDLSLSNWSSSTLAEDLDHEALLTVPDDWWPLRNNVSKYRAGAAADNALLWQTSNAGPDGLLRLLPHKSRQLIGPMLEIQPERRPQMEEVLSDAWMKQIELCTLRGDGLIDRVPGHTHAPSLGGQSSQDSSMSPCE